MPNITKKKQTKEEFRKKVRDDIIKNPKKITDFKKKSVPKKEYHHEFKRLMNIFIENSKLVNANTIHDVKLAKDEVLHHLSLNLNKSYSYAFIYIRQLALTLRKAINDPKNAAVYSIYNWQYLNSLELWTDFLIQNALTNELIYGLIHPLIEIIVGVIRFRPSARYLPMRFHCLKLLNQFSTSFKSLTPVLVNIIEIFNCIDFHQKCSGEANNTMNLMVMLHFSESQLSTTEHLEITLDQIFQLIVENIYIFAREPVFPEYCVFLMITLKAFVKKCKVPTFRNPIRSLISKISEHTEFIRKERLQHPFNAIMGKNEVFEKFVENYRIARLNELEKVMHSTRHSAFLQPHEDYKDTNRDLDEEDNNSSDLDDEEFGGEADYESAVEIDDRDDE